jgi:hypothetical protein
MLHRHYTLMKILALAIVLAVGGCAHPEKLSEQPAQAAAQIRSWVPVGTSLADAQRMMEQHHFSCSVMTNSSFGDLTNATFLYCDYREANSRLIPTVYQMWKVALILSNGEVSDVRVNTGLKGL